MNIDKIKHVHGHALEQKCKNTKATELLEVFKHYKEFRAITDTLVVDTEDKVKILTAAVNTYRGKVINILEKRENSGQEVLRSTILEELFYHLFNGLAKKYTASPDIIIGKASSYVSLTFTPKSFKEIFDKPEPYVHTKDQDFLLGCPISLRVTPQGADESKYKATSVTIPALAIECKTYLEKNMLDSCASTARRLKQAMPYCLYIVTSEYLKMSDDVSPEVTDIDEVYILCKVTNSEREKLRNSNKPPHFIDEDLLIDLFNKVSRHLNGIWWDPLKALERGKIIGRP